MKTNQLYITYLTSTKKKTRTSLAFALAAILTAQAAVPAAAFADETCAEKLRERAEKIEKNAPAVGNLAAAGKAAGGVAEVGAGVVSLGFRIPALFIWFTVDGAKHIVKAINNWDEAVEKKEGEREQRAKALRYMADRLDEATQYAKEYKATSDVGQKTVQFPVNLERYLYSIESNPANHHKLAMELRAVNKAGKDCKDAFYDITQVSVKEIETKYLK